MNAKHAQRTVRRSWVRGGTAALAVLLTFLLCTQTLSLPTIAVATEGASQQATQTEGTTDQGTQASDSATTNTAADESAAPVETDDASAAPADDATVSDGLATLQNGGSAPSEAENNLAGGGSNSIGTAAPAEDPTVSVALDLSDQATVKYNDTEYTAETENIDARAGEELAFTAAAAEGFQISAVKQIAAGVETELQADEATGEYKVAADAVAEGLTIKVETEAVVASDETAGEAVGGEQPAADADQPATGEEAVEGEEPAEDATLEEEVVTDGLEAVENAVNGIALMAARAGAYIINPGGSRSLFEGYQSHGSWSIREGQSGNWTDVLKDSSGTVGDATLEVNSNGSAPGWFGLGGENASAIFSVNGNAQPGDTYQVKYGSSISTFVVAELSQEQTYLVYFYTLIPGKQVGDSPDADQVWNGMGIGSVTGLNSPNSYTNGVNLDHLGASVSFPGSYPDIQGTDGKTYQYAAPGSGHENEKGYYTIDWFRLVNSDGANAGNNDYNNPTVPSGTPTFHYDGQVIINYENQWTVTWRVQMPGDSSFSVQEAYSRTVEDGSPEWNLVQPPMDPTIVQDGVTYTFDGWYTDAECTQKTNLDGTVTSNMNYYAKYVAENNDKLTYDGNGNTGGSTAATEGVTGKDVTVAENGSSAFFRLAT